MSASGDEAGRATTTLITVGVTCYNAEQTIARALESALAQDWPTFEVVVVDDASTDRSWDIVSAYAARDLRIRALRHPVNRGAAAARNSILEQAGGEFVVFFDDDDESLPSRARLQYQAVRAYEQASGAHLVACYVAGRRLYPNGYALELPAIGAHSEIPIGEDVADYLLFNARRAGVCYGAGTPTCALAARLATFQAVGGFDSSLRRVEDADFAIRLALIGGHFIGCPEQLLLQHATFAPDKSPSSNMTAELHLIEKHAAYLERKGRYRYARDWFALRFQHFSGRRGRFLLALALFLLRYPVAGLRHLLRSAPGRLRHERKMASKP